MLSNDQSWNKLSPLQLKHKNGGKWWLTGEEENNAFTEFVETWLQDWVGYVEETVLDVNVLMLDEHPLLCKPKIIIKK